MLRVKRILPILCIVLFGITSLFTVSACTNTIPNMLPPFVRVQNTLYVIDPEGIKVSELSAEYELIGEIQETVLQSIDKNETSNFCSVGDKIYQSKENKNEIYVYTSLYSIDGSYRYLRFVKS
jgi:hypothetical protein